MENIILLQSLRKARCTAGVEMTKVRWVMVINLVNISANKLRKNCRKNKKNRQLLNKLSSNKIRNKNPKMPANKRKTPKAKNQRTKKNKNQTSDI